MSETPAAKVDVARRQRRAGRVLPWLARLFAVATLLTWALVAWQAWQVRRSPASEVIAQAFLLRENVGRVAEAARSLTPETPLADVSTQLQALAAQWTAARAPGGPLAAGVPAEEAGLLSRQIAQWQARLGMALPFSADEAARLVEDFAGSHDVSRRIAERAVQWSRQVAAVQRREGAWRLGFAGVATLGLLLVLGLQLRRTAARLRYERQVTERLRALSRDLQDRVRERTEELEDSASVDPLTGLTNRRVFFERAGHVLETAKRYGRPCTLMRVDIDGYARIDDQYGSSHADRVAFELAERITQSMRDADLVARIGPDAFAVLMPETPADEAAGVGERVRQAGSAIRLPSTVPERSHASVSVGLAQCRSTDSLAALIARAESAVGRAHDSGLAQLEIET